MKQTEELNAKWHAFSSDIQAMSRSALHRSTMQFLLDATGITLCTKNWLAKALIELSSYLVLHYSTDLVLLQQALLQHVVCVQCLTGPPEIWLI